MSWLKTWNKDRNTQGNNSKFLLGDVWPIADGIYLNKVIHLSLSLFFFASVYPIEFNLLKIVVFGNFS